ncbi:MAG: DUF5655 domain-containing protein [Acidimicrobiales bacterium]
MPAWSCPKCQRRFARPRQSHECAPAMSLEEYFATGPPHEKPVFEAVMAHMSAVGPVHVEPVSVGIFLKRARTFAELRPMRKWVALAFSLPRPARHEAIRRKITHYNGRYFHVANVAGPADLDQDLLAMLTEAYFSSPG